MEALVGTLLGTYDRSRQNLIPILQDVQARYGYLPVEAMDKVADYLGLSVHEIFGVATFYSQFRFNAPGKHSLKVCQGTACHVRGSELILDSLSRKLKVRPGETTTDRQYSLERVMCVGSCALAPAVVLDDTVHARMTQAKVERLLKQQEGA
jgi:NADH-quinone oxidoreductase subunit E